ncbi:MAG: hypothetical protein U9Q34_05760, partial [Elusimicrobiota bacterium]|nr:hypothetical protein [Elusimicrobiota bacterium]
VLPFSGSEFENILTISPGDAVIVEGKRVLIKASWDKNLSIVPVLQIKEKAGGWISVNWDKRDLSSRQYNISRLKNEIRYRLKYRSMKSRTYHLKMRNYPQFKDIRFSVKSPAYLKTANKIYSYIPARLKVLEGSEIIIKAKADKRASKIILHSKSASNNKKINFQKNNKNDFVMVLEAYEAMNLEFEIIADDSLANPQKILQQLNIIKDKPPIADILSPLFEVEMPSGGGIKIVYHLKDDFGLSSARLRSEIRFKGKRDRSYDSLRELHDFKGKNIKEFVGDTYVFFPKFRSDARAYFYLRVFDSFPSATGFRWTESLPVKVKIKNFYKNHIEAMDALDKMKHNFTEMLKEEEKAATNLVRSSSSFKTSNFTKRWQKFKNNSAKALSSLKADPYFNAGLKNEYEMLHEDIMYMAQVRAKNIIREFQGGTLKKAVAAQKSMPSFLKRGLKTMKKIMNNQAAKDFEFKAEDWENSLSKIDKALSQAVKGKADKKLWADLSEIMKSLAGEIGAMSKILERQKYKDSFGEKKRFQIPINKASSLAGKLQEALKNRNLKEALSAAKALLEEIRKTSRVFSEYSDFMASRQGGEKLKKLKKIKELWADLRDKEQETFTKNTAFTDTLVGGINIKRKKVLERLRASAAKIIKIASNPVLKSNLPTIKFSNTKMEGIKNILEWRASLESNIEILKKTEPQSKYPNIKELMSEINFNIAL